MIDLIAVLSNALISAVVKIAADQGVTSARQVQDKLTNKNERKRQEGFKKAYQAAVAAMGELSERQVALFKHRPFVDAVVLGLLDPSMGLDLRAAAEKWAGDLPTEERALRRFFTLLQNSLTQDPDWGDLLVRYRALRDDPKLDGKIDEREMLRELRVEVQGDGAVAVYGGIALGARAVYVRDVHGNVIVNTGTGDIIVNPPVGAATGETELKAYFRSLAAECGELPLGIIDTEFARKQGISLQNVYIDLDVLGVKLEREKELDLLRRELEAPQESRENQRSALIEVIAGERMVVLGRTGKTTFVNYQTYLQTRKLIKVIVSKRRSRMVVLGAAGSGKTTFVNYLTYRLARAYADGAAVEDLPEGLRKLVPVRLVLRKAAGQIPLEATCGQAAMLWNALEEDLKARLGEGAGAAWERLKEMLYRGECLVLLDGLDEVPEAGRRRACLLEALQGAEGFLNALPKTQRVVLTARPYAYASPEWQLQGCAVFNLAPLSAEQVRRFVKQWYASVRGSVNLDAAEAQERAEQLAAAIAERDYLGDLASRPLLLTQMAMVHSTRRELPEDRADLYEKTVDLLLVRWQKSGVGDKLRVGGQMVAVEGSVVRSALALLAYETHARQRGTKRKDGPGDIPFGDLLECFYKKWQGSEDLTVYLENRTGLLVEREPKLYCFVHRSFQEYLAACHILDTSADRGVELRKLVAEDASWWREVILLAVGKTRQGGDGAALELVRSALLPMSMNECSRPGTVDWRAAVLGGQALVELRVLARQPEQAEAGNNVPRARKWLVGVLERNALPARERVEAGNVLARLGDERFNPDVCYLPKDKRLGFVRVAGGVFRMGSDPERDSDAYNDEQPQHSVKVSEFYIQRYPVTVAQFGAFVKQSRHSPQDPNCLQGIANHPVVNVTWDDAVAYCQWLDGWLREKRPEELRKQLDSGGRIRLPTEAEWEKAARETDGRIYPWGDAFDTERANTSESEIGGTSPVGCFAGGASSYGVLDMSGNVWEWCADWWDERAYAERVNNPVCDPRGPEKGETRACRGGSWSVNAGNARCADRYGYASGYFYVNLGFRLVLSLF